MLLDLSAVLLLVYAIPVCSRYAAQNGNDPGEVVVDEVVGQWIVLGLTPPDAFDYVAGFLLFRLFDILKPFPIRRIERMSHAGRAIMLDDVAAGLYAALALLTLRQLFL